MIKPDVVISVYLIILNLLAFLLMGLDKAKARRHRWRIPEKTLFLSALLGGSVGPIARMQVFLHKTKHASFRFDIPCILILQLALAAYLFFR